MYRIRDSDRENIVRTHTHYFSCSFWVTLSIVFFYFLSLSLAPSIAVHYNLNDSYSYANARALSVDPSTAPFPTFPADDVTPCILPCVQRRLAVVPVAAFLSRVIPAVPVLICFLVPLNVWRALHLFVFISFRDEIAKG